MAMRPLSTAPTQSSAEATPATRAQALIAMLPGDSAFKKTLYGTMGAGLSAWLVAQGIYIPNEETLILVAFLLVSRALYVKLSGPVSNWLEAGMAAVQQKLEAAGVAEQAALQAQITELQGFLDHTEATTEFMVMKRENLLLEAELAQLQADNALLFEAQAKLSDALRREQERVREERRQLVERLIAGVMEELKDPRVQQNIIERRIKDLSLLKAA